MSISFTYYVDLIEPISISGVLLNEIYISFEEYNRIYNELGKNTNLESKLLIHSIVENFSKKDFCIEKNNIKSLCIKPVFY